MSKFERIASEDQLYIKSQIESLVKSIFNDYVIDINLKTKFKSGFKKLLVNRPVLEEYEISIDDNSDLEEIFSYLKAFKEPTYSHQINSLINSTKIFLKDYPKEKETEVTSLEKLYTNPYRKVKQLLRNPLTQGMVVNIIEKAGKELTENESNLSTISMLENPFVKQIIGEIKIDQPKHEQQIKDEVDDDLFFDASEGPIEDSPNKRTSDAYFDKEEKLFFFDPQNFEATKHLEQKNIIASNTTEKINKGFFISFSALIKKLFIKTIPTLLYNIGNKIKSLLVNKKEDHKKNMPTSVETTLKGMNKLKPDFYINNTPRITNKSKQLKKGLSRQQ